MHAKKAEISVVTDLAEATWREVEWGEMHVGFESYHQEFDDTSYLEGLPSDMCQVPHWGYVISGRLRAKYPDHEEVISAGEAYYLPPGHSIVVDKGTEIIEFSPKDQFRDHKKAVEANIQRKQESETKG